MNMEGGFTNRLTRDDTIVTKEYIAGKKRLKPSERVRRERAALIRYGGLYSPLLLGSGNRFVQQSFIQGESLVSLAERDELCEGMLFQTGQLLRNIHIPVKNPHIRLKQDFDRKMGYMMPRAFPLLEKEGIDTAVLEQKTWFDWQPVDQMGVRLIHGDFWLGNIIQTDDGPRAVDWEGAGEGTPYDDFAAMFVGGFQEYNVSGEAFYSGYGARPDYAALQAFVIKKLVYFMGRNPHNFIKRLHDGHDYCNQVFKTLQILSQ